MFVVAASVLGPTEGPSDDCGGISVGGDAVALADGAGSAKRGAGGSRAAVALVLGVSRDAAVSCVTGQGGGELFARRSREISSADRALATTRLFALASGEHVTVGQAGDGLVGVLLTDHWEPIVGASGAWPNQTSVMPWASVECRVWPREVVRAIILTTDGASDDLVPRRAPELVVALADLALSEGPVKLEARLPDRLTAWPTPSSYDDRSIAIMIPEAT